jgi:hypothetical protein
LGQFNDAENSVNDEVIYLSDLWRGAEVLPENVCKKIHANLNFYVDEVLLTDWGSLAEYGQSSAAAAQQF